MWATRIGNDSRLKKWANTKEGKKEFNDEMKQARRKQNPKQSVVTQAWRNCQLMEGGKKLGGARREKNEESERKRERRSCFELESCSLKARQEKGREERR